MSFPKTLLDILDVFTLSLHCSDSHFFNGPARQSVGCTCRWRLTGRLWAQGSPDAAWGKKRCPHHCPGDARRSPTKMLLHLPFASQILVALQVHQIVGCTGPLFSYLQLVSTFQKSSRLRSVGVHFGSTWNEPDNNVHCAAQNLVRFWCRKEDDTVGGGCSLLSCSGVGWCVQWSCI